MGSSQSNPSMQSKAMVKDMVAQSPIVVFSGTYCVWCVRLQKLLQENELLGMTKTVMLDEHPKGQEYANGLFLLTSQRSIPNVYVNGVHVGGYSEVSHLISTGELQRMLKTK
eukprot:TRINITY_DN33838_c0_g1_i1.p1 TRINITY_DN33838_c0_g1~~TRINITY_DN33838_c0_g1_i1.p1  ORF type:complete len:128 (+),score=14.76 TRINITY_DN33838_c0_g1_i1:51-386(+)